jgi:hypothetical protein
VSVTVIKDLAKAVREQDEHRKALREKEARAGGSGDTQPPPPQPGPVPDSSANDS